MKGNLKYILAILLMVFFPAAGGEFCCLYSYISNPLFRFFLSVADCGDDNWPGDPFKPKALAQEKEVQLMITPVVQTQTLVEWFISPQGQTLAQSLGYLPLYPVTE